jgi:hypothetical protein
LFGQRGHQSGVRAELRGRVGNGPGMFTSN